MKKLSTIAVLTSLLLAGCASMQTEAPKDERSAAQVDTAAPVDEVPYEQDSDTAQVDEAAPAADAPVDEVPYEQDSDTQVDVAAPVDETPYEQDTAAPDIYPEPTGATTTPLEQAEMDERVLPATEAQPPASEVEVAADPLTIPGAHKDPASPLAQRVIYFDFDSAVIHPRFQPILEAHATYLKANPQFKVTLEGHADERGSREYNLALGQRRAESVRRALALLGVPDNQMEAVSFGEERPAVEGHDESAWKMNRRTEIRYVDE